ncbi:MAG: ABC transporter permease [Planctomycetaceae bacterium]|jgi:hypothetical protein|nr:ABC transporter permease [Planctomycetaceae bacterium]MBT6483315.1 ABC transporter permease [Planctomycetaceae bacterium]
MSFELPDFSLLRAFGHWALIVGALIGVAVLLSMMTAALGGGQLGFLRAIGSLVRGKRQGGLPWGEVKEAYAGVFRGIRDAIVEIVGMSPRRVWALGMLTFKESTRRKALLVFVIFALLFMFGGWFLADANPRADLQVKVHVSFVLTAISWLILPVALLLSCWGLPEDIKQRTLHTVVTKPVRRSEVILGRMVGYSCIGTLVLSVMGVVGYIWIVRLVPANAQSQLVCRVPVYGNLGFLNREGDPGTGVNVGDIWEFRQYVEGASKARAVWEFAGVTPKVMVTRNIQESGETVEVKRLLLETRFEAFRTHKGDIKSEVFCELFFTRNTRDQAARALASCPGLARIGGMLSDGDFRGAAIVLAEAKPTPADFEQFEAGCRDFANITRPFLSGESKSEASEAVLQAATDCANAADAGSGEKLSASLKTFSGLLDTHADELSRRIFDLRVSIPAFEVQEYQLNLLEIDPAAFQAVVQDVKTGNDVEREIDLFDDIVDNGKLRVEVSCVDSGQYVGAARPDLFIRTPDRPFWVGFSKSIVGIWLMMELVVILGVTAGSLLNGPVSTFLVFGLVLVGGTGFRDFLQTIVAGQSRGGGVFESIIRIVKHMNPTTKLETGVLTTIVKGVDGAITGMLWLAAQIIPDFRSFGRVLEFLPNGFDVSWSTALLPSVTVTVGYLIPCLLVGYFCLKLRELEQK